jgi:hypothetical protein
MMWSPFDAMRLSMKTGVMLAEANMVIGMRMLGMAGMWRVTPAENLRMVAEKQAAGLEAAVAMGRVAMAGGSAAQLLEAGLKPVARRTRGNVRRLAKRGPGKG